MSRTPKDVIKGVVKKPAPASTTGTDPSDPWSAKAGIEENVTSSRSALLTRFYKSRGWNVNYITKNKKVSQSKTNEFIKWKSDHGYFEEVEPIQELSADKLRAYADKAQDSSRDNLIKRSIAKKLGDGDAADKYLDKSLSRQSGVDHAKKKLNIESSETILELSTDKLAQYKTAASKQASELDKAGGKTNIEKANKRFGGIIKATNKQFDNDAKVEDVGDPQSATQSPGDCANNPDDVTPRKMSKAGKLVKELHAKKRMNEELYDKEKEEKAEKPYGKKPNELKNDNPDDTDSEVANARMVMKGGKTLTGQTRDTVQIDPMMKNRSKMPDYNSGKQIKQ
jgi:hypothetical protein